MQQVADHTHNMSSVTQGCQKKGHDLQGAAHRRRCGGLGLQAALDELHGADQQAGRHASGRASHELVAACQTRACVHARETNNP